MGRAGEFHDHCLSVCSFYLKIGRGLVSLWELKNRTFGACVGGKAGIGLNKHR